MKNKIKNLIIIPLLIGIIAFLYFIGIEWLPLQPFGYTYVGLIPMLSGFLCCGIIIIVGLISILVFAYNTKKTIFLTIFISSISVVIFSILGFKLSESVRVYEFKKLSIRSVPLIEAISLYKKRENKLPEGLKDLIPDYISKIPQTGMAAYSTYNYSIIENKQKMNDNNWILLVNCPRGVLNWDVFFYLPNQRYPKHAFGGSIEKIGSWAYVHE